MTIRTVSDPQRSTSTSQYIVPPAAWEFVTYRLSDRQDVRISIRITLCPWNLSGILCRESVCLSVCVNVWGCQWGCCNSEVWTPLAFLLCLCSSLRLMMLLKVAVRRSSACSRYCRSLWDWLIPGSFLCCRRLKNSRAPLWRKLPAQGRKRNVMNSHTHSHIYTHSHSLFALPEKNTRKYVSFHHVLFLWGKKLTKSEHPAV